MATPVVATKWAGNFDCSVCRRKRLMAVEFSKSALDRHRSAGHPLRCKPCTAAQELQERMKAQEKKSIAVAASPATNDGNAEAGKEEPRRASSSSEEFRLCEGSCQAVLPQSSYNRNQWAKGKGKSRCRSCVQQSIDDEAKQHQRAKEDKIEAAREKVKNLKQSKTSTPQQILQAESEISALEAEMVTGLKPVKMSGRGGGRWGRGQSRHSTMSSTSGRGRG